MSEKSLRNGANHGFFGPGKGRAVHDWLFGLVTNAKRLRGEATEDIFIQSRKAKRKFRYKQSGFGRELGLLGLESFLEPKAIIGN
ncbi:MAG: hypothetical protein ACLQVM_17765 [Terriglobia bacterium]